MPSHVESRECQLNRMKGWAAQVAAVSATEAKQEKLMDCSAHSAPRARTHRIGAPCPLSSNRLLRDHILVARTRTTVVLWLFSREGQNESSAQLEAGLRVGQHCNASNEVKWDSKGNHPWTHFITYQAAVPRTAYVRISNGSLFLELRRQIGALGAFEVA